MQLMQKHNTHPTNILAFTVKITKDSDTQPYLYSLAPAQYLKKSQFFFLHLTGFSLQQANMQIITKH